MSPSLSENVGGLIIGYKQTNKFTTPFCLLTGRSLFRLLIVSMNFMKRESVECEVDACMIPFSNFNLKEVKNLEINNSN